MPHDESPCHFRQTPLEKQTLKYLPISSSPRFPLFLRVSLYTQSFHSFPYRPYPRVDTGTSPSYLLWTCIDWLYRDLLLFSIMAPKYAGMSGRPLSLTVSTIATMGFLLFGYDREYTFT